MKDKIINFWANGGFGFLCGAVAGFAAMCITNNAFWFFGQLPLYACVISGFDSQENN